MSTRPSPPSEEPPALLESWKAIAAYLNRDVSTVQRWEKREGMPVHRHLHDKIGSVYAYPAELDVWWQGRRQGLEQEEEAAAPPTGPAAPVAPVRRARGAIAAAVTLALAAGIGLGLWWGRRASDAGPHRVPRFQRITDLAGLEESPALSPDGKTVAFTAVDGTTRQVFVRLISGGPPLRLTSDPADHRSPRWLADGSGLVYFSPAAAPALQGDVWQVPALGGEPLRVISSVSDADVSKDGRLTCFQLAGEDVQLVSASPDGAEVRTVGRFPGGRYYRGPRWSPDGRWIAYEQGDGVRSDVFVIRSEGNAPPVQLTRDSSPTNGQTWTPDGGAVVFSSSRESTLPYLPRFTLWEASLSGGPPVALTSDEASYGDPDVHRSGTLVASRLLMRSDVWTFPLDGTPPDNVHRGRRITHQTGQVRTPTVDPKGDEVAFLSDSGGHANVWVMEPASGRLRQITHEQDVGVAVGVPIWSTDGRSIAFASSRGNVGLVFGLWAVNPDGSGLRNLAPRGWGAAWSDDAQWLYYVDGATLQKMPAGGGAAATVRSEPVRNVVGTFAGTLYYVVERPLVDGRPEFEIRAANPEDAPSRVLARVDASRVAPWQIVNPSLSPDGKWVALPLTDGLTTNVWALSTSTGEWRQVTDFGGRATLIARRVSWSADGRSIVAAVSEGDADIVIADGMLADRRR